MTSPAILPSRVHAGINAVKHGLGRVYPIASARRRDVTADHPSASALLVPIKNRSATWTADHHPADWCEQHQRWCRLHYARVTIIVAGSC